MWRVISDIVSCGKVSLSFVCARDAAATAAIHQSVQLHVTITISRAHTKPNRKQNESNEFGFVTNIQTIAFACAINIYRAVIENSQPHQHRAARKTYFLHFIRNVYAFFPIFLHPLFAVVCRNSFFCSSHSDAIHCTIHSVDMCT